MENKIHYDVRAMKTAGAEALRLLQGIRRKTVLLEEAFSADDTGGGSASGTLPAAGDRSAAKRKRFSEAMQSFQAACNGYEKLIRYMEAAANIYGLAQKTLQEDLDF